MKNWMLHLKDKSGRMVARLEMTNNRMFKLNLKIKTISLRSEWKVKDEEEVFKMSKALEVQTVVTEATKNKTQVVAHVMKDEFCNPPIDEESDTVVLKEKSILVVASRNKEKIKETRQEKSKRSLITKKSTSSKNLQKKSFEEDECEKAIGYDFSVGHSMDMPNLLTGNSSNSSLT